MNPRMPPTCSQNALNIDLVIVDPPRKGLDEEVVQALCLRTNNGAGGPKRLIYVSCGFDAFRQDFSNLTVTGQWKLDHAEGHVLFP
jgi:23S rRNA (uracil1939-C5)-methyltransferase